MKISEVGLNLIKTFEGLQLSMYKDAVGLPTIGYGHLLKSGEDLQRIDEATADKLLRQDVRQAENCVNQVVQVNLAQNQFDALVSFVFNVGAGNFYKSTLLKLLNKGNYTAAAQQFLKWDKAGATVLAGLTRRRMQEMQLFLS